jgi:glycosyltransferase involved in cell wall biosynthesis
MPGAHVTAVGESGPPEHVAFIRRPYRSLTDRFVEAGALAWLRDLDSIEWEFEWIASLELCSLVTGQASHVAARQGIRQAVVIWQNDPRNPLYRLPPYRYALGRSRRADLYLCLIEAAKEHCVALGLPEERCAVVQPGVDTEVFHPPPRPVDEPSLVFASSLVANKGLDRVLEAHALVRRRIPEARLFIAGSGPLERMARDRAAMEGGVEFAGHLDRQGVADLLRRSAVFVTAPRPTRVWNEQFGLAYIEAMSCGLPVVTTACGTNHEAVHEPNLLVADDPSVLAEALLTFLGDPSLRARVSKWNRKHVLADHDLHRQSALMAEAFREA